VKTSEGVCNELIDNIVLYYVSCVKNVRYAEIT